MKAMKYLSMVLLMLVTSVRMFSCSDDDDSPVSGINNFYIEFDVSGGGLTAAELNNIKSGLASIDTNMRGYETEEATYIFRELLKELRDGFAEGLPYLSGTLDIKLTLKSEDGRTVMSGVIHVTQTGASYEY